MPSAFAVRGDRLHPRKEVTQTKGEVTTSTEEQKAAERRWREEAWVSTIFTSWTSSSPPMSSSTTSSPHQAARMILSLLERLGHATSDLLLSGEDPPNTPRQLERIATASAAALNSCL